MDSRKDLIISYIRLFQSKFKLSINIYKDKFTNLDMSV